jgi:hypothetical protein
MWWRSPSDMPELSVERQCLWIYGVTSKLDKIGKLPKFKEIQLLAEKEHEIVEN